MKKKQLHEGEQRRPELTMEMAANHAVAQDKGHQIFGKRQRGVGIDPGQPLKPIAIAPSKPSATNSKPSPMNGADWGMTTKLHTNGAASGAANGSTMEEKFKHPGNFECSTSVAPPNQRTTHFMTQAFSTLSLAIRKAAAAPAKLFLRGQNTYMKRNGTIIATRSGRQIGNKMSNRETTAPPPEDCERGRCGICHRTFKPDRILKHEEVCQQAKRKIFDTAKHRIKGTDAENFLKNRPRNQISPKFDLSAEAINGIKPAGNSGVRKSNWRQQHAEFITAIRAAKRGGKSSDLPILPPSENPNVPNAVQPTQPRSRK